MGDSDTAPLRLDMPDMEMDSLSAQIGQPSSRIVKKRQSVWLRLLLFIGLACLGLWLMFLMLDELNTMYIPGADPNNYKLHAEVPIQATVLTSIVTQLPYPYYTIPMCKPDPLKEYDSNLGDLLTGERRYNSLYNVTVLDNKQCAALCDASFTVKDRNTLKQFIDNQYRAHWLFDNLPVFVNTTSGYVTGFRLGDYVSYTGETQIHYRIFNHQQLKIQYRVYKRTSNNEIDMIRIVGFETEPLSIDWTDQTGCNLTELTGRPQLVSASAADQEIKYSYSTEWVESETRWSARWVQYFMTPSADLKWSSILYSFVIAAALALIVIAALMRALNKDIAFYNDVEAGELRDDSGWKMVHRDVFRPPMWSSVFATVFGIGVQVLCLIAVLLVFACLGLLSPATRGALPLAFLITFICLAFVAGYCSAWIYKAFGGKSRGRVAIFTGFVWPVSIVVAFFILWIILKSQTLTSLALPISSMILVFVLVFLVYMPISFFGSYLASHLKAHEFPIKPGTLMRPIPETQWYNHWIIQSLIGSALPFATVLFEVQYLFISMVGPQLTYMFGFLMAIFIILLLVSAEVSIVLCYFRLCREDYRWHWFSFTDAGFSALYIWIYLGTLKKGTGSFASLSVFFFYRTMGSALFFFLTGVVGWCATYMFLRKIYCSIKLS